MAGPENAHGRHGQELATESDAARTKIEAAREAGRQAAVAVQAQVEAARQAQEDAARALRVAEGAAAEEARGEAERFQKAPGLRGRIVRRLAR